VYRANRAVAGQLSTHMGGSHINNNTHAYLLCKRLCLAHRVCVVLCCIPQLTRLVPPCLQGCCWRLALWPGGSGGTAGGTRV